MNPRLLALIVCAAGLAGCSLFGMKEFDDALLSLQFVIRSDAWEQPIFRITYTDRWRSHTLDREDFTRVAETQFNADPFETAPFGSLHIACSVLDDRHRVLATEEVDLPARSDWRYGVSCTVSRNNPYRLCFGCSGFEARPLDPAWGFAPGDSLFVVWGGMSISNPVDY